MTPQMTHKRIRPFNTRDTYPEQNLDNDLCQTVIAGGVVYLRGQIGQDLGTVPTKPEVSRFTATGRDRQRCTARLRPRRAPAL